MAVVSFFNNGKIEDIETNSKKGRFVRPPKPGLLTSFTNRTKALVLGIFVTLFGLACVYFLFTAKLNIWQKILFVGGSLACIAGPYIVVRSILALNKTACPQNYFYYDNARLVLGTTNSLDQAEIDRFRAMPIAEQVNALVAVSPGHTEIPVKAIAKVSLKISLATLDINKMTIWGPGAEMPVVFFDILPSGDFSGIKSAAAFNSISQYYTATTGKALPAAIENA
jgi:hypothetical protein